jgi:hypothetical protein
VEAVRSLPFPFAILPTDLASFNRSFVNSKGGANTVVISGAPSLISLSDSNVTNRILMQFAQRAASMK